MELNCTYHFSKEKNPTLTVGEIFEAHCPLSTPVTVDVNKLKIKIQEPNSEGGVPGASSGPGKYDLVIVKTAKSDENLGLALTSYTVGSKDIPEFVITDGTQELVIKSHLQFQVTSILKPDEKAEMYGPVSGVTIAIPMVYWLALTLTVAVLIATLGEWFRRRWVRKQLLEKLAELNDGTQPIQQFFTTYRKIQRENLIFNARSSVDTMVVVEPTQSTEELVNIVKQVEKSFKIFIARRFQISQFQQGWPSITRELSEFHDLVFSVMGSDLVDLSREFQKVGVGKNKLEGKDVILISEKTRKWVEKADTLYNAILAKDSQLIRKLRGAK